MGDPPRLGDAVDAPGEAIGLPVDAERVVARISPVGPVARGMLAGQKGEIPLDLCVAVPEGLRRSDRAGGIRDACDTDRIPRCLLQSAT